MRRRDLLLLWRPDVLGASAAGARDAVASVIDRGRAWNQSHQNTTSRDARSYLQKSLKRPGDSSV